MSRRPTDPKRVLGIDPTHRGFGFAVLEWPNILVDWGVKSARTEKTRTALLRVAELIDHYAPEVVVLEDTQCDGSRRCPRVRRLLTAIRGLATSKRVFTSDIPLQLVQKMFLAYGATSKHQIAHAIAEQLPDMAPHAPRRRKPWMGEDYWMPSFDAVALVLTYFHSRSLRSRASASLSAKNQPHAFA